MRELKTFAGKEVNKNGVWFPVTVEAYSIREALSMLNSNSTYRGRFSIQ